jgi:CelD/BcsL family acetyltransferase involved in cellulose biosynthesis
VPRAFPADMPEPLTLSRAAPPLDRSLLLVPQDHIAWAELLAGHQHATPFHHPAWSAVLADSYGYRSFAAVLGDGTHSVAGLPLIELHSLTGRRRWLSLPFTDECSPLEANAGGAAELVQRLEAVRIERGLASIEIRAPSPSPDVWQLTAGFRHTLDLHPDPDAVRSTFSRSQVQRNLVRAEREGARVEWAADEAHLTHDFYRLHVATRRRQGVPVQPRRFFKLLWSRMIEPGLGFVLLAYVGETPVAAAVFLVWRETVIYKFGASDRGYWKLRPNHLLFWNAIRWGCENGFQRFDFGRTEPENEGLRAFKAGWGTREEPLVYSVLADAPPPPRRSHLTKAMGASIRRSPPFVCRTLGAAFYRFAP